MVQNNPDTSVKEEDQLDARLAELLRIMRTQHLALQEVKPGS
jgi:hypothetical protein